MLAAIPPSKLAYSAYVIPYLYGPHNGLSLILSLNPFAALTPSLLSINPSGSGSKDIKMEPIIK